MVAAASLGKKVAVLDYVAPSPQGTYTCRDTSKPGLWTHGLDRGLDYGPDV